MDHLAFFSHDIAFGALFVHTSIVGTGRGNKSIFTTSAHSVRRESRYFVVLRRNNPLPKTCTLAIISFDSIAIFIFFSRASRSVCENAVRVGGTRDLLHSSILIHALFATFD